MVFTKKRDTHFITLYRRQRTSTLRFLIDHFLNTKISLTRFLCSREENHHSGAWCACVSLPKTLIFLSYFTDHKSASWAWTSRNEAAPWLCPLRASSGAAHCHPSSVIWNRPLCLLTAKGMYPNIILDIHLFFHILCFLPHHEHLYMSGTGLDSNKTRLKGSARVPAFPGVESQKIVFGNHWLDPSMMLKSSLKHQPPQPPEPLIKYLASAHLRQVATPFRFGGWVGGSHPLCFLSMIFCSGHLLQVEL